VPRLEIRGDIFIGSGDPEDRSLPCSTHSSYAEWIELNIGVTGQPGSNIFTVHAGTPEAVLDYRQRNDSRAIGPTLLVREWSEPDIERALRDIVARCDTGDWRLSVGQLERYLHHEFQDYDEVPSKLPVVPMLKACKARGVHLSTWEPLADEPVCLEVRLTVGVRKQPNDHEYVVTIATPAGLRAHRSKFVLADRAVLLVHPSTEYRWDSIADQLNDIVSACRGTDWAHCQSKLDRYFESPATLLRD
jgi:Immunity protein 8